MHAKGGKKGKAVVAMDEDAELMAAMEASKREAESPMATALRVAAQTEQEASPSIVHLAHPHVVGAAEVRVRVLIRMP